jgi:hypothetical protein
MSRRKKETLSRREFLKATGILAGSVLLSACSEALQLSPTPTLSPTSTRTNTPTPTKTATPTQTFTPEPILTPTPTETPGPYWQLGNFGEYIHAVNDNGQETFNFLAPFEQWPAVTDIKPSTIEAIHKAYESIKLSDGTSLVKPMNGPEYQNLPPLNWIIGDSPYGGMLFIGNDNTAKTEFPRTRYLGGLTFYFSGNTQNPFTENYILITMQVEDKSQPKGYSLWTGFYPKSKVTGMLSDRIPALFNNKSQLSPLVTFNTNAGDSQYNDLVRFLQSESEFDKALYEQALRDFYASKPNDYLNSHLLLTNIGATRWHLPKSP